MSLIFSNLSDEAQKRFAENQPFHRISAEMVMKLKDLTKTNEAETIPRPFLLQCRARVLFIESVDVMLLIALFPQCLECEN